MPRPRVFVSSTFYDLKHIRASLEVFIESLGFDAVLFEKGDVAFHPDVPLDESCYREAANADIFVLIIGGRYGSAATRKSQSGSGSAVSIYESITKTEFESAQGEDVPTFILLDAAVAAEYQTYLKNRDNDTVSYAHVDSIGVFRLLDSIFEKVKNNPVFHFERATQIESWLREQWAGLFRELLRARSQQRQISALNSQVSELRSINETLKTYMEAVLTTVRPEQSESIIKDQEDRLVRVKSDLEFVQNSFVRHLMAYGLDEASARDLISANGSADEIVSLIEQRFAEREGPSPAVSVLRRLPGAQRDYNSARAALGLAPIDFSDAEDEDIRSVATRLKPKVAREMRPKPSGSANRRRGAAESGSDEDGSQ